MLIYLSTCLCALIILLSFFSVFDLFILCFPNTLEWDHSILLEIVLSAPRWKFWIVKNMMLLWLVIAIKNNVLTILRFWSQFQIVGKFWKNIDLVAFLLERKFNDVTIFHIIGKRFCFLQFLFSISLSLSLSLNQLFVPFSCHISKLSHLCFFVFGCPWHLKTTLN